MISLLCPSFLAAQLFTRLRDLSFFLASLQVGVLLQDSAYASHSQRLSLFDGLRVPQISLRDYIQRISRYSKCSNVCFCMAFSYLQKLAQVIIAGPSSNLLFLQTMSAHTKHCLHDGRSVFMEALIRNPHVCRLTQCTD